jgi:hypothetical protein
MYYSSIKNEFYGDNRDGTINIPDDVCFALFSEKYTGGTIIPDENGYPIFVAKTPLDLSSAQTIQLALIESTFQSANTAPIAYMNTTFQGDIGSQALLAQVITALGGMSPVGLGWYDINNVKVPMTNAQLVGLGQAIFARGQPLYEHKQTLKTAIRTAADVTTVQGITW